MNPNRIEWMSWDRHRRSVVLAERVGARLTIIQRGRKTWNKVALPVLSTLLGLLKRGREILFVQNPSLLLASIACAFRSFGNYRVVQDLHSFFFQPLENPKTLRDKVYRMLSIYCIRNAEITIVTNEYLKRLVEDHGGRAFILQDLIPNAPPTQQKTLGPGSHVVFICTYSADEPLREVAEAASRLGPDVTIHVTGRPPKNLDVSFWPKNMIRTGFLSDEDYWALLGSSDVILALTTREHTLLCGAYEGLAMGRAVVMSRTAALEKYFGGGVTFSETTGAGLSSAVRVVLASKKECENAAIKKRDELHKDWATRFNDLSTLLGLCG